MRTRGGEGRGEGEEGEASAYGPVDATHIEKNVTAECVSNGALNAGAE